MHQYLYRQHPSLHSVERVVQQRVYKYSMHLKLEFDNVFPSHMGLTYSGS